MDAIFESYRQDLHGNILHYDSFIPFSDISGFKLNMKNFNNIIDEAQKVLDTEYSILPASVYMQFKRNGNRSVYEALYFERRRIISSLLLAEAAERKGRFTDKLIDGIWLLLEESTWVIPAHNQSQPGLNSPLTYAYTSDVDYIDLFAAETGSLLAWIYYIAREFLDEQTPIICNRILYELNRRIVSPYMTHNEHWWMGFKGNSLNNWTPWIVSNILTVCALCIHDIELREKMTDRAMVILDNFTNFYHSDGGCDEGPGYWGVAGASYFDCAELLYDLSGGYINIFGNILLRNMGEYIAKVNINDDRFLNFADCPARVTPNYHMIARFGRRCNSKMLESYGISNIHKNSIKPVCSFISTAYRCIKNLCEHGYASIEYVAAEKVWFDGICVMAKRESVNVSNGLYLAAKGGHNGESHNHNDVGNFIVYNNGKPILIDVGVGTYTADTFNSKRWKIWTMQSAYHNLPTINGNIQAPGGQYKADNILYNQGTGSLSMSLINAYPKNTDLLYYTRKFTLENSEVIITDDIKLQGKGNVIFNLMTVCLPKISDAGKIIFTEDCDCIAEYNCELTAYVDEIKLTDKRISSGWGCDVLYRIRLETSGDFSEGSFTLIVKQK
ncbi:MAG: heparinase II/III domain-containing protein [Eubacteriales bacterium]